MIDFSRAQLTHLIVHFVGNKGLGEELTYSDKSFEFKDDFVKETVLRYFLAPFKTDIYHQFKKKIDITLNSVANNIEDVFTSRADFVNRSKHLARLLYDQSMHPKIHGGEFYVCFFRDAMVDGELCDAIGLFKTENKETFLKVYQHIDEFELDCDNGININKLDKGVLIFNTDKETGYKLSIVDANNKVAECALYWAEDFLNSCIQTNAYYHTKNFIDASVGFCEEILTEANNVDKQSQAKILNESIGYFANKDTFNVSNFEKEVLIQPELIDAFRDYRNDFNKRMDLTAVDDFNVSQTAVKKNQKYMRTIIKLDKNFHIYIHSRHDYVEKGYDEERGLKFYKLFFVNEEL